MKCKFCKKEIEFSDWLCLNRSCIDCFMIQEQIPKLTEKMKNKKWKEKFEKWKDKKKK